MTPNDAEIDVLLRRQGKVADGVKNHEHLDADELNAFAEGALPAAARSRYVSHLADCDDCRRSVSQLAGASGVLEPARAPASESASESWWKRIGALLSPSALRYAAFVAVLVAVVGIGFGVWQKSHRTSNEIAPNDQAGKADTHASQPQPVAGSVAPTQSPAIAKAMVQSTPTAISDQKQPESNKDVAPPPPKPADAVAQNETVPVTTNGQADPRSNNAAAPSYAPPPPTVESERSDARSREQNAGLYGPRRGESNEKYKTMDDRSRSGDVAKERDDDRARINADQPAAKEETKTETAGRKRSESRPASLAGRDAGETRQEAPKSDKAGPPAEADTRSVGGRKFTRQGNAWIDTRLKSSMSIKTISRGSEDFEKLDSGLRSISQQFNGPVVVVWKGKAYRIQ